MIPDEHRAKLPVDVQTFEIMREEPYIYVDKTRHIARMLDEGRYYFLSRPRRFGKSLLVSTLRCVFQAKKHLFEGLWLTEHAQWEWQEYPVILIDFSNVSNRTPDELRHDLHTRLSEQARIYGLSLSEESLTAQFSECVLALHHATGMPVVVLIDEYDKPIIDHLGRGARELQIAEANRDILKTFFGVLKSGELAPILRFVFLTGISRFSKVSIFSELNNLIDLSMERAYAEVLGYTQSELETSFKEAITAWAAERGCPFSEIVDELTRQYNGYRFTTAESRVYNPFSILRALRNHDFRDYWFESATPTFLVNLLREKRYDLPKIQGLEVGQSIFTSFDLAHLRPEALLFQTGYLTITDVDRNLYTLDYPNQEVRHAFTEALLFELANDASVDIHSHVLRLPRYLTNDGAHETFFTSMQAIFAAIPYDIQSKRDEAYYHTMFYLIMSAAGMPARSSVLTCDGRIDLLLEFRDRVYIIEFKCNQSAEAAIQQIRTKQYAAPYRETGKAITLLGLNFDTTTRNLAEWKVVHD